jgi:hypothetical protein
MKRVTVLAALLGTGAWAADAGMCPPLDDSNILNCSVSEE